jgi:hypothetical protein
MNPNDPQAPNPFNDTQNGGLPPDPMQNQNVMPDPTAMPQQDWRQPVDQSSIPDWQRNIQPIPNQPLPQGQAPQTPSPVVGGVAPNLPPTPTVMPMQQMPMNGTMPSAMPGQTPGMPGMDASMMAAPGNSPSNSSGKRKIVMVVVLLVALGVLVGGGFYVAHLIQKNHDKNATNNAAKSSESSTSAPDISTLSSFSFVQPSAAKLNGMTVSAGSTSGETVITGTVDSSTNTVCNIFYGIISKTDLPGTTIGDVVSRATSALRDQGVTITGPNNAKALVLKNSATSATYSLPSVNFSYTKSGTTEVATYSISEFKDGTHAAVLQACAGGDTVANLTTKLGALAPVANAIEVKTP